MASAWLNIATSDLMNLAISASVPQKCMYCFYEHTHQCEKNPDWRCDEGIKLFFEQDGRAVYQIVDKIKHGYMLSNLDVKGLKTGLTVW